MHAPASQLGDGVRFCVRRMSSSPLACALRNVMIVRMTAALIVWCLIGAVWWKTGKAFLYRTRSTFSISECFDVPRPLRAIGARTPLRRNCIMKQKGSVGKSGLFSVFNKK